jgi:hypothetical protein
VVLSRGGTQVVVDSTRKLDPEIASGRSGPIVVDVLVVFVVVVVTVGFIFFRFVVVIVDTVVLLSISPTFYEELLRQNPFAKKLQTQIVST